MEESSEVPGPACLTLREEKETNKRKPEGGGNAQGGSKGGCKGGRVTPYSITPNLG